MRAMKIVPCVVMLLAALPAVGTDRESAATPGVAPCPVSVMIADCDSGVAGQLADGSCLATHIEHCASAAAERSEFASCVAELQGLVSDLELAALLSCSGAVPDAWLLAAKPFACKGKAEGAVESATHSSMVCAKSEASAKAAAKEAAEAAAKKSATATCESLLGCEKRECPKEPKHPKRCATEVRVTKFSVESVTCTPTTQPCNPPVQGSTLWDCATEFAYNYACKCHCEKQP